MTAYDRGDATRLRVDVSRIRKNPVFLVRCRGVRFHNCRRRRGTTVFLSGRSVSSSYFTERGKIVCGQESREVVNVKKKTYENTKRRTTVIRDNACGLESFDICSSELVRPIRLHAALTFPRRSRSWYTRVFTAMRRPHVAKLVFRHHGDEATVGKSADTCIKHDASISGRFLLTRTV